ncbi:hypothetical protein B0J14DRAFT_704207 [Halenospora varia]|nr:hypothetical protein B0J14DRAFT_704207 [Halenospora varia]
MVCDDSQDTPQEYVSYYRKFHMKNSHGPIDWQSSVLSDSASKHQPPREHPVHAVDLAIKLQYLQEHSPVPAAINTPSVQNPEAPPPSPVIVNSGGHPDHPPSSTPPPSMLSAQGCSQTKTWLLNPSNPQCLPPARVGIDDFHNSKARSSTTLGTLDTSSLPNPVMPILDRRGEPLMRQRLGPMRESIGLPGIENFDRLAGLAPHGHPPYPLRTSPGGPLMQVISLGQLESSLSPRLESESLPPLMEQVLPCVLKDTQYKALGILAEVAEKQLKETSESNRPTPLLTLLPPPSPINPCGPLSSQVPTVAPERGASVTALTEKMAVEIREDPKIPTPEPIKEEDSGSLVMPGDESYDPDAEDYIMVGVEQKRFGKAGPRILKPQIQPIKRKRQRLQRNKEVVVSAGIN